MSFIKKISYELNIKRQCSEAGISVWECPSFLFLAMGIIDIFSILASYIVAQRATENPEIVILVVSAVAVVILIIGKAIVGAFEKQARDSRLKSEFVSIASHQLRTPLSSMRWYIEMILSGKIGRADAKVINYIEEIRATNNKILKLVQNLLELIKIEEEKIEKAQTNFSLVDLTREVINDARSFARAHNTKFFLRYPKTTSEIFGDPVHIKIVIQNFIDNAIKYSDRKGKIVIKIEHLSKHAKLSVQDNGVGIPLSEQKFIFKKFFRSKNIMRLRTEGSGLGLYIAKKIIEKQGGKVGFASAESKGSTFWFTLPKKRT